MYFIIVFLLIFLSITSIWLFFSREKTKELKDSLQESRKELLGATNNGMHFVNKYNKLKEKLEHNENVILAAKTLAEKCTCMCPYSRAVKAAVKRG